MIVLGGFDCTASSFLSPNNKSLYPLSDAAIFNTMTTQWYDQPLGGLIPNARTFHTAVKSNVSKKKKCILFCVNIYFLDGKIVQDKIIICGGQDARVEPFQTYLSGSQMTAVLNIKNWQWTLAPVSMNQPLPTSFSIATLVNESSMVYGLGKVVDCLFVCTVFF